MSSSHRKKGKTRTFIQPNHHSKKLVPIANVDLKELHLRLTERFGWAPREFQLKAIAAQLEGHDVVVHAGTGSGKTAIAAGPHIHPKREGMLSIFVSPLIALQEEQARTFKEEFGLSAITINSNHGGCSPEVIKNIVYGKHNVVILSPEMLLSETFVNRVLRHNSVASRIISVVIDEAHVVSHWGAGFRKKYGELGKVRAFIRRNVPIVAMSATMPRQVRRDVLAKLEFGKYHIPIDVGNDRPNVALVVRAIQNPMNTYSDLQFVIPADTVSAKDIPLTYLYADEIVGGLAVEDYLRELLPTVLRNRGLIRSYNAGMSPEYRLEVMEQFRKGLVRILVCTDAAGMGCNVPNIDRVVQWRLPKKLSTFIQRAGRAARGPNTTGLAILLAEKSAFSSRTSDSVEGKSRKGGLPRNTPCETRSEAKSRRAYAEDHGVNRGSYSGETDEIACKEQPVLNLDADDEGLQVFVQTGTCRRKVLKAVYNNPDSDLKGPCCDICNPELLGQIRPAPPPKLQRPANSRRGLPHAPTEETLRSWRQATHARDFPNAMFGPCALLKDETISLLSSVGDIKTEERLTGVLAGLNWTLYEKYGAELLSVLQSLDIPKVTKKKASKTSKKRVVEVAGDNESHEDTVTAEPVAKRARATPVTRDEIAAGSSQGSGGVPASSGTPRPTGLPVMGMPIYQPQPVMQGYQAGWAPYYPITNHAHYAIPTYLPYPQPFTQQIPTNFPAQPYSYPSSKAPGT